MKGTYFAPVLSGITAYPAVFVIGAAEIRGPMERPGPVGAPDAGFNDVRCFDDGTVPVDVAVKLGHVYLVIPHRLNRTGFVSRA